MDPQRRIEVYARQRGSRGCRLEDGTYVVAYWSVARRITPRQHRRWRKQDNRYRYSRTNVPF